MAGTGLMRGSRNYPIAASYAGCHIPGEILGLQGSADFTGRHRVLIIRLRPIGESQFEQRKGDFLRSRDEGRGQARYVTPPGQRTIWRTNMSWTRTLCAMAFPIVALARLSAAEAQVPSPGQPSASKRTKIKEPLDQRLLSTLFRPKSSMFSVERDRRELTFQNFLYGWNVGWSEPEECPDDAPRFRLMRIQRSFWEREVRIVSPYADGGTADELEVEMEIELPVSRRFLIEVEPAVKGVGPYGGSCLFGAGDLLVIPQVMLYETKNTSFSSGLSIRAPTGSQSVGAGRTSMTPILYCGRTWDSA